MNPISRSEPEPPKQLDSKTDSQSAVIGQLIAAGRAFYSRNWVLGATGSLCAVVSRDPFEMVITANGVHKGTLTDQDFLRLDSLRHDANAGGQFSPEAPIHRTIISARRADAVLHTQSVWSTILSDLYSEPGGLTLQGFEILKNLSRIKAEQDWEWVPIVDNMDNSAALSRMVAQVIKTQPGIHGLLIRKRGLYVWGANIAEATQHIEIFEFLFEVLARQLHIFSQIELNEARGNRICS